MKRIAIIIVSMSLVRCGFLPPGCNSHTVKGTAVDVFSSQSVANTNLQPYSNFPFTDSHMLFEEDGALVESSYITYMTNSLTPNFDAFSADGQCHYGVSLVVNLQNLRQSVEDRISNVHRISGHDFVVGEQIPVTLTLEIELVSGPSAQICGLPPAPSEYEVPHTFASKDGFLSITDSRAQTTSFAWDSNPQSINDVHEFFLKGATSASFTNTPVGDIPYTANIKLSVIHGDIGFVSEGDCS